MTENTSPFGGNTIYVGTDVGLDIIQEKQGDERNGSVKQITSEYETEEMVGDVRGMWTFDQDGGFGDGSEKVTNGTFPTNTSAWTLNLGTGSIYVSAGELHLDQGATSTYVHAFQQLNLIEGHTYKLSVNRIGGTQAGILRVSTTQPIAGQTPPGDVVTFDLAATTGTQIIDFVAGSSNYLSIYNNGAVNKTFIVDDISVEEVIIDNSVKTNNLTNNGGVSFSEQGVRGKAASFDGSTQYLEIGDNTDLSITGKFTLGAWIKTDTVSGDHAIITKYNNSANQLSYNLHQS